MLVNATEQPALGWAWAPCPPCPSCPGVDQVRRGHFQTLHGSAHHLSHRVLLKLRVPDAGARGGAGDGRDPHRVGQAPHRVGQAPGRT